MNIKAEPVAWGQLGLSNGKSYLRMNYEQLPYPPPPDIVRNLNLVPLYTADAIRAAVLAERERAAKVCEEQSQEYEPHTGQPRNLAYQCADAIRKEPT